MEEFVKAIVLYITKEKEICLGKTKLIKILYLIDVENYRLYGKQLFDLKWVYYKFGPYDYSFDDFLNKCGIKISETEQTHFLSSESLNFGSTIENTISKYIATSQGQIIVKRLIDQFSSYDLNKLLDFVYFETEPMGDVQLGDKLNFEKIDRNNIPYTSRNLDKSNQEKLNRIKSKFKKSKLTQNLPDILFNQEQRSDLYYEQIAFMDVADGV